MIGNCINKSILFSFKIFDKFEKKRHDYGNGQSTYHKDITNLCDFNLTVTYLICFLNSSSVR